MDVVLLHNPSAGSSAWSRKELIALVRSTGWRVTYLPLKRALDEPKRLAKADVVIVAGGDGAVRKAAFAVRDLNLPLAPLPLGTANNISRSLGLPGNPEKIVEGWKRKQRRIKYDLGVAQGPWGKRRFVEGVGVGLISRTIVVIEDIDEVSVHEWKKAKHKLHRDACVAAALAHELQALPVTLKTDTHDRSEAYLLLEILNIRRAGPAVDLALNAKPSDGQFDLVSVTEHQRPRLLKALKARLADAKQVRALTTRKARRVELTPHRDCELRIDDGCVALPANETVEFTIERNALEFMIPG
jgi:diacylglycerol kinase family enzyme